MIHVHTATISMSIIPPP